MPAKHENRTGDTSHLILLNLYRLIEKIALVTSIQSISVTDTSYNEGRDIKAKNNAQDSN